MPEYLSAWFYEPDLTSKVLIHWADAVNKLLQSCNNCLDFCGSTSKTSVIKSKCLYMINIHSLLHIKKCWGLFHRIIVVKDSSYVVYVFYVYVGICTCGLFCEINFLISEFFLIFIEVAYILPWRLTLECVSHSFFDPLLSHLRISKAV